MKKLTAMLLAFLMLLLPVAGQAEDAAPGTFDYGRMTSADYLENAVENGRRITMTVKLSDLAQRYTGEPAIDGVIADVLNALTVTGYAQGDEAYFSFGAVQPDGAVADILTFGALQEGEDTYIASNLLGDTIVVAADEVQPLLERLIDMLAVLGVYSNAEAEDLKAELGDAFADFEEMLADVMKEPAEELDPASLDYAALENAITPILEKVQKTEVTMQPRNCDMAASMMTVELTNEDLKGLLAGYLQFMLDNPALAEAVKQEMDFENTADMYSPVYGETITFEELIRMCQDELQQQTFLAKDASICIYLDEAGAPVAINAVLPVYQTAEPAVEIVEVEDAEAVDFDEFFAILQSEQEGGTIEVADEPVNETMDVTLDYTRLTMNDGVAHSVVAKAGTDDVTVSLLVKERSFTANLAVASQGETKFTAGLKAEDKSGENLEAYDVVLDVFIAESTSTVTTYNSFTGKRTETTTTEPETSFKVYISTQTTFDEVDFAEKDAVTLEVNGVKYGTLCIDIASGEPGASIKDGDVIRPAALEESEFINWFVSVMIQLDSWGATALQSMPASLINLINSLSNTGM